MTKEKLLRRPISRSFCVCYREETISSTREPVTSSPFVISLALRLLCGGHAAPSANNHRTSHKEATRLPRSSRGGCRYIELRRRRRSRPATTTSSFHYCECDAVEWFCCARQPGSGHRHRDQHHRHDRELERERHCGRKLDRWIHLVRRRLYRSCGLALSCHSANHRD